MWRRCWPRGWDSWSDRRRDHRPALSAAAAPHDGAEDLHGPFFGEDTSQSHADSTSIDILEFVDSRIQFTADIGVLGFHDDDIVLFEPVKTVHFQDGIQGLVEIHLLQGHGDLPFYLRSRQKIKLVLVSEQPKDIDEFGFL